MLSESFYIVICRCLSIACAETKMLFCSSFSFYLSNIISFPARTIDNRRQLVANCQMYHLDWWCHDK